VYQPEHCAHGGLRATFVGPDDNLGCSCRGCCKPGPTPLIGFQDDKLPAAERKARTLVFDQHEMAAFIAGAKNGDFDHLLD
jgi:hypothetical protein